MTIKKDKIKKVITPEEKKVKKEERDLDFKKANFNYTFINSKGVEVKIGDIINDTDYWKKPRQAVWILSHNAILKIADEAGIGRNFTRNVLYVKGPENAYEHAMEVTITCFSGKDYMTPGCRHGIESNQTMIGEANTKNTRKGSSNLLLMAEKRAQDRAVMRHLNLLNIYSEEEIQSEEEKEDDRLLPHEFEQITPLINKMTAAKDFAMLIEMKNELTEAKTIYPVKIFKYLIGFYGQRLADKII